MLAETRRLMLPRHRRQRRPVATRPGLPPLLKVFAGQALSITPHLARHEVYRLPPPRRRELVTANAHDVGLTPRKNLHYESYAGVRTETCAAGRIDATPPLGETVLPGER